MRFFSCILVFVSLVTLAQKTDKRLAKIDQDLNQVLATWQAPGFAVAVVEKDKVIFAKGYGYRDFETKAPATANTLFAIGSSSKAFTSAVLGVLRGEGKIDFEDHPNKYLGDLKFNNDVLNTQVIIKDLMSHRTGMPRHDFSWYMFPTDTAEVLIRRLQYQEPFTGLRKQWYYNNFMFLLQGSIGESITGKPWKQNVQEMFFDKLEMKTANLDIPSMEKAKEAAFGYQTTDEGEIKKMDYYRIRAMAPAGSINSSVNEMANWLITWINGGKFKGQEIIPAAYITEAMSSQMVMSGALPTEYPDLFMANYGYGWMTSSYRGHYRVEHGGNIDGFSANAAFFPSDSLGIVVLANQNGSSVPSVVRNIIADRMLNLEKTDWNSDLKKRRDEQLKAASNAASDEDKGRVDGTRPSHILMEYAGTYDHPGYGPIDIQVKNDSLFAETGHLTAYLKHYHYDVFSAYWIYQGELDTSEPAQLKFNFRTGLTGEIAGAEIQFEPTIDPIMFERTPATMEVDTEVLTSYIGEYQLGSQTTSVYIKDEKKLFVYVPGQPEYELVAIGDHKFNFKTLEGFKVQFNEAEDGSIESLSFIQPNGTFTAERKKE